MFLEIMLYEQMSVFLHLMVVQLPAQWLTVQDVKGDKLVFEY